MNLQALIKFKKSIDLQKKPLTWQGYNICIKLRG